MNITYHTHAWNLGCALTALSLSVAQNYVHMPTVNFGLFSYFKTTQMTVRLTNA